MAVQPGGPSGESLSLKPQHLAGHPCLHTDPEITKLVSSWQYRQSLEHHLAQPNKCMSSE